MTTNKPALTLRTIGTPRKKSGMMAKVVMKKSRSNAKHMEVVQFRSSSGTSISKCTYIHRFVIIVFVFAILLRHCYYQNSENDDLDGEDPFKVQSRSAINSPYDYIDNYESILEFEVNDQLLDKLYR